MAYIKIKYKDVLWDYKIKLNIYEDNLKNIDSKNALEAYLSKENVEFEKIEYVENYFIHKVKNIDSNFIEKIKKDEVSEFIRFIEPIYKFSTPLKIDVLEENVKIKTPKKDENFVTVGILDNGVKDIAPFKGWTIEDKDSFYEEEMVLADHGTFVAGLILYGDELENKKIVDGGFVKVFDATVVPNIKMHRLSEDELILNIKKMIEKHHDTVKIWNLSLSVRNTIKDDIFSDFSVIIDMLQQKYDILICKSGGNGGAFLKGEKKHKILEGSDSVLSLVTGSISDENTSSLFSRTGPGPENIIKPDVVSYGGDSYAKKTEDGVEAVMIGVKSFSSTGKVASSIGTSFANARMTSLSGNIYKGLRFDLKMYVEFNPLLIKALIIHSAIYPDNKEFLPESEFNEFGFGIPRTTKDILTSIENRSYTIINGELDSENEIIYEVPLKDLKRSEYKLTLVSNPILDIFQVKGYSHSDINIEVFVGKNNILKENQNIDYSKEFHNVKKLSLKTLKNYDENSIVNIVLTPVYSDYIKKRREEDKLKQKFSLIIS